MPYDLIINLRARRYRREPKLLGRMRSAASGRCRVRVTADLAELGEVVEDIARRGSDRVILSGGDGTLMAGVTELWRCCGAERLPEIVPIPGGTVGTVARNWGVRGDPVSRLRWALDERRPPTRRPTLLVSAAASGAAPAVDRVGFIFGTGLVAKFFELYYERGAPGYGGSARIVARVFVESFGSGAFARRVLDPLPCALWVDGRRLPPDRWSLICAAVVPNLGIHMLVNYRAAEDPARPHLVASPLSARRLGPRAPFVLTGRPIGGRGLVDDLVRRFAVEFSRTGPYVLDGELLQAARVSVTAGPLVPLLTPPAR